MYAPYRTRSYSARFLAGLIIALAKMSSIKPDCFCLCAGDFVECSCPNVDKCAKCRSECHKETDPPKGKKKRLALRDIGNSSRFQFVSKEDAEAAQKSCSTQH